MRATISRLLLAAMFIATGINHFVQPAIYRPIMPAYLPWHGPLIAISGAAELVLGIVVLFRRWDRFSRWAMLGLLAAVFPANVEMVAHAERFPSIPAWALWARLPIQFLFGYWVWKTTEG